MDKVGDRGFRSVSTVTDSGNFVGVVFEATFPPFIRVNPSEASMMNFKYPW
jgi:hypothetical protein